MFRLTRIYILRSDYMKSRFPLAERFRVKVRSLFEHVPF